jgi:hypothetical protein
MFLQNPVPVLLIVIVIKIAVDLKAHLKERAKKKPVKRGHDSIAADL